MKKPLSREKGFDLSARPEPDFEYLAEGGQEGFPFGFSAKHLFVFALSASQDYAFDKRRPNQESGLTLSGPCPKTGYAQTGYISR